MNIIKESAPHIHRRDSLARMLLDVIIAIFPVVLMALVVYTFDAMRNILVSCATMVACEFVFVLIMNRIPYDGTKHSFKEHWQKGIRAYRLHHFLAPLVSGIIFALIMPSGSNPGYIIYLALIFGSIFGIVIGKLVFGGTGQNIFNPAAVGMVFAKLCFGTKYVYGTPSYISTIGTGGTILTSVNLSSDSLVARYASIGDISLLDMLFGRIPGVIGEAFKITILIGLVYLLVRRAADYRVVVSYLGGYALLMAVAGIIIVNKAPGVSYWHFLGFQMLSGGVLFGATFMFTDPVTMPINAPGRVLYGLLGASLTVIIRLFGALPEGVAFSLLLCNLAAPAIDHYAYSSNRFTPKKLLVIGGIFALFLLAVILGLVFQPGVNA